MSLERPRRRPIRDALKAVAIVAPSLISTPQEAHAESVRSSPVVEEYLTQQGQKRMTAEELKDSITGKSQMLKRAEEIKAKMFDTFIEQKRAELEKNPRFSMKLLHQDVVDGRMRREYLTPTITESGAWLIKRVADFSTEDNAWVPVGEPVLVETFEKWGPHSYEQDIAAHKQATARPKDDQHLDDMYREAGVQIKAKHDLENLRPSPSLEITNE